MRNLHLLRRYIREAIDLGNVQFSPKRRDGAQKDEPNTPEEQKLYRDLIARVDDGENLSQSTSQTILDLLDSRYGQAPGGSGFFSEPPPNQPLYRGQDFDMEWIKKHVARGDIPKIPRQSDFEYTSDEDRAGITHLKNAIRTNKLIDLAEPFTFNPLRGWSKIPAVANEYATRYARLGDEYQGTPPKGVAVVLVAYPSTSGARFLDLSTSIYKTDDGFHVEHEEECVNLQPVKVHQAAIFIYDNITKYS
jgi:hypothetical protein